MTDDQLLSMLSWESVQARFWKRVDKTAPNGCWNYTSFRTSRGKTRPNEFQIARKDFTPRRVAWAMHTGEWPDRDVLVMCGNPLCVNWDHLVLEYVPTPEERLAKRRITNRRSREKHAPADKKPHGNVKYATDEERQAAKRAQAQRYNATYRAKCKAERAPLKAKPSREQIIKKPACKAKTPIGRVNWLARLVGFRLAAVGPGRYEVVRVT